MYDIDSKRMVIWGTGNVCNHILKSHPEIHPVFFVDSDVRKMNEILNGRYILLPSQIEGWEDLCIIVATDNYSPIKEVLLEKGLKEGEHFVWYRDFFFQNTLTEVEKEAEEFLVWIEGKAADYREKSIICSDFLAFDKGVCDYINQWAKRGLDAVLLSEAYWISDAYAKERMDIPVCRLPAVLAHNQYIRGGISDNVEVTTYVEKSIALTEASINLRMGYPKMAAGYEYVVCYWADKIIRKIITQWNPKEVILWNAFYAFHLVVRNACEEMGIPLRYMEFGNIPGTIQVEDMGQMGESYPARYPEEFQKNIVLEEDYKKAEDLIEELYYSRVNRNAQPINNLLDDIKKRMKNGRPIVLYAGQNDNASGLQPYTEKTKKYHSPIFKTSDEAAIYLAKLCEKNDWNYIYKPHPMMMETFVEEKIPANTIVVNAVDINDLIDMSDVVVTILSTVSYIALIRKKPVLMLGYTQLKEKGCTYEAFSAEEIYTCLEQAIRKEQLELKGKEYIRHMAQMTKFYIK